MDLRETNRIGLTVAMNYFTTQGYSVALPITQQWYDFIAEKDGKFYTVLCKVTKTENNSIDFRMSCGSKSFEYDNIFNRKKVDYLFCVNKDMKMWLIPIQDLMENNKRSIVLNTEPSKNKQGFQTCKYLVS